MIDTNVLISIIFFPSVQMNELKAKLCKRHTIVLCSHIMEELNRVVKRKFAHKLKELDEFLTELPYEFVYTPAFIEKDKFQQYEMLMIILFLQQQYWKMLTYS